MKTGFLQRTAIVGTFIFLASSALADNQGTYGGPGTYNFPPSLTAPQSTINGSIMGTPFIATGNGATSGASANDRASHYENVMDDFGAKGDDITAFDATITAGTTAFSSQSATFLPTDCSLALHGSGSGCAGTVDKGLTMHYGAASAQPMLTHIVGYIDAHHVTLADAAQTTLPHFISSLFVTATPQSGAGSYDPGDTVTLAGGAFTTAAIQTLSGVELISSSVVSGGSGGGADGTCTVKGTTGSGVFFQETFAISGGSISGSGTITLPGYYTTKITNHASEPVVGAGTCAGLTGATVTAITGPHAGSPKPFNLLYSGPDYFGSPPAFKYQQPWNGVYTVKPAGPVATTTSGTGTGLTVNPVWVQAGWFDYGTDDTSAIQAACSTGYTKNIPVWLPPAIYFTTANITCNGNVDGTWSSIIRGENPAQDDVMEVGTSTVSAATITIKNFQIDANQIVNDGLWARNYHNSFFEYLLVSGNMRAALHLGDTSYVSATHYDSKVQGLFTVRRNIPAPTTSLGLFVDNATDYLAMDGYIGDNFIEIATKSNYGKIENFHVFNFAPTNGGHWVDAYDTGVANVWIGNYFDAVDYCGLLSTGTNPIVIGNNAHIDMPSISGMSNGFCAGGNDPPTAMYSGNIVRGNTGAQFATDYLSLTGRAVGLQAWGNFAAFTLKLLNFPNTPAIINKTNFFIAGQVFNLANQKVEFSAGAMEWQDTYGTGTETDLVAGGAASQQDQWRFNGAYGAETAVQAGDDLGDRNWGGYDGTNFVVGGTISATATTTWTNISHETQVDFYSVPSGSTTKQHEGELHNGLALGNTTPQGVGAYNGAAYWANATEFADGGGNWVGPTIPKAKGGTGGVTGLAAATNLSTPYVLCQSAATGVSHSGDTAETNLAICAIPAGAVGATGGIQIETTWSFSGSAGIKTAIVRLSAAAGITGSTFLSFPNVAANTSEECTTKIFNQTASTQIGKAVNLCAQGAGNAASATGTINTANASYINIDITNASAADTTTLVAYRVILTPSAGN